MEGFKGTPGPWIVRNRDIESVGSESKMTAMCYGIDNANLIAAAPELLEAIQTVKQEVGHFLMHQAPELLSEIDAAIAKALGQ